MFDVAPILLHSDEVPAQAKLALEAATHAPPGDAQQSLRELAARSLYRDAGLECDDARELAGLPAGVCS